MIKMMTPALEFTNGTTHNISSSMGHSITKNKSLIGHNIFVNNCCACSIINSPSLIEPWNTGCQVYACCLKDTIHGTTLIVACYRL